jgi:hypothetical protein
VYSKQGAKTEELLNVSQKTKMMSLKKFDAER